MEKLLNVKNYPLYIWVILVGVALLAYNFDLGIIVMVTGVFIWVYNRNKTDQKKKKKKSFDKSIFKMNSSKVTYNGKSQEKNKGKNK